MLFSELGIGKYILVKYEQCVKELLHSSLEFFMQDSVTQQNLDLILLHTKDLGLIQLNTFKCLLNFKYVKVPLNSEGLLRVQQEKHGTDSFIVYSAPSQIPHYYRSNGEPLGGTLPALSWGILCLSAMLCFNLAFVTEKPE